MKPNFDSVLDLGLRDVGVRNDPRRFAGHFGKAAIPVVLLAAVFGIGVCAIATAAGAEPWMVIAFALVWGVAALTFVVAVVKRAPRVVVRIDATGTNQATRLVIAQVPLLATAAAIVGNPILIPVVVLAALVALAAWLGRGELPGILSDLRALLHAGEAVLGDGVGMARGMRGRREAFRLIVATDRRLIVVGSPRSSAPFVRVDVPYEDISRFGIEWKVRGRTGVLWLMLRVADGEPADTHEITYIGPANLVSIARALRAHGVQADDPALVAQAEEAWDEATAGDEPAPPVLDRAAMRTRAFDRSLWLLLVASAAILYLTPLSLELATVAIALLCLVCGYTSGTRSSLAYVVPLNLLVTPTFFLADAYGVIVVMLILTALAGVCLAAGSALRGAVDGAAESPARGGFAQALRGPSLIRISGLMLAGVMTLVLATAAAGVELSDLGPGADEAIEERLRADGRSNLTGRAASLTYTRAPDLREFVTDEDWGAGPNDGARWELRSASAGNDDVISLSHYIFEPRLDDTAALQDFLADKDEEHSRIAGSEVSHSRQVVDGRTGYVWRHGNPRGYWHRVVWFPQPVHTVRLECVAKVHVDRFKRLCDEAMRSLKFH